MLARYLARHRKPVRYAIEHQSVPGGMQAIQNFIRLALQAHGVPRVYREATNALSPGGNNYLPSDMGPIVPDLPQTPTERRTAGDLFATGNPGALMAYLDQMGERGLSPEGSPFNPAIHPGQQIGLPVPLLLGALQHILGQVTGPDQQAILRGFHPNVMRSQSDVIRDLLRSPHIQHPIMGMKWWGANHALDPASRLLRWTGALANGPVGQQHPAGRQLLNAADRAVHGDTLPFGVHDLAAMLDHAQGQGHLTSPLIYANEEAQGFLHSHVIPHLLGVGRQALGGS